MRIHVVNQSSIVTADALAAMVAAIQTQIDRDFLPAWDATLGIDAVNLVVAATPATGAGLVLIRDRSDEPDALGYHQDATGMPTAEVFAVTDRDAGCSLSVTLSHEVLEMIGDPTAARIVAIGGNRYPLEVCDAVEDDSLGYEIAGVRVSDFVLPAYFGFGAGTSYDFMTALSGPCPRLTRGGYLAEELPDGQWTQITARLADGRMAPRAMRLGRLAWRSRAMKA